MPIPEAGRTPAPRGGGGELTIASERADGAFVVRLDGELDLRTVPDLRRHLADALEQGTGPVVIDLRACTFMDSTGLSALLNALRRLTRAGRRLALVCQEGPIVRLLQTTHLDGTFAVHDSVEAALGAAGGPGRAAAA